MFDRIRSWFGGDKKPPAPAELAEHVVHHDAFDRRDLAEVLANMGALQKTRERLAKASPVGGELLDDIVYSLMRARPTLTDREGVRPSHQQNWQVLSEAMGLPDWHRLHQETKCDPWFAGMAACSFASQLLGLIDQLGGQQETADALDQALTDLAAVEAERAALEEQMAALDPSGDPADADQLQADLDTLAGEIDQLTGTASGLADDLDNSMTISGVDVAASMQQALGTAADKVGDEKEFAALWGTNPGTLEKMSAEQHIQLAERLDSTKLRELAKLFGAMTYDVGAVRKKVTNHLPEEVYAIEYGRDLSRVLPSELVKLRHPIRKREFYLDFVNGRLQQYALRGVEKQARGGIVLLEDGSGSMAGNRELFAKATSLHLMNIAREEGRSFTAVMFGGPGQYRTFRFETAADYTTDRMVEWAETFIDSGGTCFMTPMSEALRLLTEEWDRDGAVTGDIVLITDGEASVEQDWYDDFKSEQKRLEFRVHGVQVGGAIGRYDLGLDALVDGDIATITDLFSARDARSVYARV